MSEETKELLENEEEFTMEYAEDKFHTLRKGDIIEAKVILVRDDEAYVDIGGKSDMVIPLRELTTDSNITSAKEIVKNGDVIKVAVVRAGGEDGVLLSRRRLEQEKVWTDLIELSKSEEPLDGKIVEVVKGGVTVKINGLNAFMPASQATLNRNDDLNKLVGETVKVKVIECDPARRRFLVSRRSFLEEAKKQAEKEFFSNIEEGKRVTGPVTRITNFGAFVDLGSGVEGLIHISEMSWKRIKQVEDLLHEGDIVEVVVLKIDRLTNKISLSMKQIKEHPWIDAIRPFAEGKVYTGKVTKIESFGAFVSLAADLEGLVHISQISEKRINNPSEVVNVGDEVTVKIIKIDYEKHKVSLSMRQIAEDVETETKNEFLNQQSNESLGQSLGSLLKDYKA